MLVHSKSVTELNLHVVAAMTSSRYYVLRTKKGKQGCFSQFFNFYLVFKSRYSNCKYTSNKKEPESVPYALQHVTDDDTADSGLLSLTPCGGRDANPSLSKA